MNLRESKDNTIRVLIVDDHPLIREGLAARIGREPDMTICAEADSVREALACLDRERPDVVTVDLALKGRHGLQLIQEIKRRGFGTRILVLTSYSEDMFGRRALRMGAHGYVNKAQEHAKVISAIRAVAAGKRYLSDKLAQRLLDDAIEGLQSEPSPEVLSNRELQIFELIGEGKSTRQVSEQLHLSVHTIETHRERIRAKLKLQNGHELVKFAVQWALEKR